jgi:hypothetical protein
MVRRTAIVFRCMVIELEAAGSDEVSETRLIPPVETAERMDEAYAVACSTLWTKPPGSASSRDPDLRVVTGRCPCLDPDPAPALNVIDFPSARLRPRRGGDPARLLPPRGAARPAQPPRPPRGWQLRPPGLRPATARGRVRAHLARPEARTAAGEPTLVAARPAVAAFARGAPVLTDDFAPVDQLLTPRAAPPRRRASDGKST